MKISESLVKFYLHDSSVDAINYQPEAKRLEFTVDLCEEWIGNPAPDAVFDQTGKLVFEGVEQLEATPPLKDISEENAPEILRLEHKRELDSGDLEGVWGLFELWGKDEAGIQRILEFTFAATHFEWFPDD